MSPNRPPLASVPMFAPCPACSGIMRARVNFRRTPVQGTLSCPWCQRRVNVLAPEVS